MVVSVGWSAYRRAKVRLAALARTKQSNNRLKFKAGCNMEQIATAFHARKFGLDHRYFKYDFQPGGEVQGLSGQVTGRHQVPRPRTLTFTAQTLPGQDGLTTHYSSRIMHWERG
jgi:hypothetical protein